VYPTKQATGVELFELVHSAAENFPRVALYFENSLLPPDLSLLPVAAAAGGRLKKQNGGVVVEAAVGIGLAWQGGARVDGKLWPAMDSHTLWLSAGTHRIEPSDEAPPIRLLRLNAELDGAATIGAKSVRFSYRSNSRAFALVDRAPANVQIDGLTVSRSAADPRTLRLPRGQHTVTLTVD